MKLPVFGVLLLLSSLTSAIAAETGSTIEQTRAVLNKWIETKRILAEQQSAWEVEKQTLAQAIALYEAEVKLLTEEIRRNEQLSSDADKAVIEAEKREQSLREAAAAVLVVMDQLEEHLLKLIKAFPQPLRDKIKPLAIRIPDPDNRKKVGLSVRMQNIVGILVEVDKFNREISIHTELRKAADGGEFEVQTLYLGLGQGFYTDATGQKAGLGYPINGEWQWVDQPELAGRIREAIDIKDNRRPASFVGFEVSAH